MHKTLTQGNNCYTLLVIGQQSMKPNWKAFSALTARWMLTQTTLLENGYSYNLTSQSLVTIVEDTTKLQVNKIFLRT